MWSDTSISRRQYLSACCISLSASVAGCSAPTRPWTPENPDIWSSTKSESNPVIDHQNNPQAGTEQYSPGIVIVDGTYHAYVKSDEGPTLLRYWTSSDGRHWNLEDTTFSPSDSNLSVNHLTAPLLLYTPESDKYHLFYRGEGGSDDDTIGHASGTNPDQLFNDSKNPVIRANTLNEMTELSTGQNVTPSDIIGLQDGTYVLYGMVQRADEDIWEIYAATSNGLSGFTPHSVVAEPVGFPRSGDSLFQPTVFRKHDRFYMIVGMGKFDNTLGSTQVFCMVGDAFDFTPVRGVVVDTGPEGSWDDSSVYGGQFIKEQDGRFVTPKLIDGSYSYYYNGQDTTNSDRGRVGLVEFGDIPSPTN